MEAFQELLKKYQMDRISALLGFVKQNEFIDYLVFGVDNVAQLEENIKIFNKVTMPEEFINDILGNFNEIEKDMILPSRWHK